MISYPTIPFVGFIMIAIGQIMRKVGAKGIAGSEIILVPEKQVRI